MSRGKEIALVTAGVLVGVALSGPAATAGLMANPSSQSFYLEDRMIDLEAYSINGNNYVKLRDVGQAVGFGVDYDAGTNSVIIHPDKPYAEEVKSDSSMTIPQDGSRFVPQAGNVIRCDDGTSYTITDVSRYDKNYFASGPVGELPAPTCDWTQFDQPELPKAENRRFNVEGTDYLFIRNLYETRRMLYTLYNAMGANPSTWQNGQAVRRSDGTPWVHIQLTMPEGESVPGFWPWKPEVVTEALDACPCGDWCLEVWDVYADGIFQRTEYKIF